MVAYLEPQVIADVEECTGAWCESASRAIDGWIEQERLWGVYPDEEFEE